ncbi:MAG: TSCPD domain protein [Firmicutes bacterium ADurb.Bin099]|nr:MAG: TSCPD domain protein [Firmicutes bacterium ADurb.Bin099]
MYRYKTKGTCSTEITFEIQEGKLKDVKFTDGCSGNLQGISKLLEGMEA